MPRTFARDRVPAWLVHCAVALISIAVYWIVAHVPTHRWVVFGGLVVGALSLFGLLWALADAYLSRVRVEKDHLCIWTLRGRRHLAWHEISKVEQAWPTGDLLLHTESDTIRIELSGRVEALALVDAIRANVAPGVYCVLPIHETMLAEHAPRLPERGFSDPLEELAARVAYRSSPMQSSSMLVELETLRPKIAVRSWLVLGPSFVVVLFFCGWSAARQFLLHANAATYWKRVATVFGPRVRLVPNGFESLDGRWRYRAFDQSAYWEQLEPRTRKIVASYRVGAVARAPECSHEGAPARKEGRLFWLGMPSVFGGSPIRLPATYALRIERDGERYRLVRIALGGERLGETWHARRSSALAEAEAEHGVSHEAWQHASTLAHVEHHDDDTRCSSMPGTRSQWDEAMARFAALERESTRDVNRETSRRVRAKAPARRSERDTTVEQAMEAALAALDELAQMHGPHGDVVRSAPHAP